MATEAISTSDAPASNTLPALSVTILAFKRREEVRLTLEKLTRDLDYPKDRLEIIVVDNASSDGTTEMVTRDFPQVECLTLPENIGVAGWSHAFAAARGDYFLVLDDDSAPLHGIREAIEHLEANPAVGILACRVVGGAFPTDGFDLLDRQSWVGFIGCGAIIRRALYERIGGFAEWIFIYAHEWEYGLRCLAAGFAIQYFAACVVEHRAAPANRSPRRLISQTVRNELLTIHRHFPQGRLLYYWRAVVFNVLYFGRGSAAHVAEGVWRFLRDARRVPRAFVKAEVQAQYTAQLLSAAPVWPRLSARMRRVLRV